MKDALFAIGYLIALFAVAGLILLIADRITNAIARRRNPPEKLAAEREEREARIQSPDWAFYADHLQRDVPQALRNLYANKALVLSQNAESCGDQSISEFGAIDEANLLESKEWIGADVVAIAHNIFGDPIYLRPGSDESNAVYVTYHDGGDTEQIAADIAEFVDSIQLRDSG